MESEHADHAAAHSERAANDAIADREIRQVKANLADSSLANCTKVVRIFVINPVSGRAIDDVAREMAKEWCVTRADVFVVRPAPDADLKQPLKPLTWLGGPRLVEHHEAHEQHWGTIPVVKGKVRDQIEWQCSVPFKVSKIVRTDKDTHGFFNYKGPDYPFTKSESDLYAAGGGPSAPIRSGPTTILMDHLRLFHVPWKQLYKAHFKLDFDGNGRWRDLDPDFYCEWH